MIMTKKGRQLCWVFIVSCITIMVVIQTGKYSEDIEVSQIVELAIYAPQKILFNNMLYYSALLYIKGTLFLEPLILVRVGSVKGLVIKFARQGCALALEVLLVLAIATEIGLIIQGSAACLDLNVFIKLFMIIILWNSVYSLSYIISESHVVGIMMLMISQLGYLIIGLMVQFIDGENLFYLILAWKSLLVINAGMGFLLVGVLKRKEWLK